MADPIPVPQEAIADAEKHVLHRITMWLGAAAVDENCRPTDFAYSMRSQIIADVLEAGAPAILTAAAERLKAATADEYTAICTEAMIEAVGPYEDLLASVWLYIGWRYVTRQITTEQKELFADSVDRSHERSHDGIGEPSMAERWWRE